MEGQRAIAHFLLTPEVSGVKMSDLAKPATSADAQRRGCVGVNSDGKWNSEVFGKALEAKAMGNASGDSMQFGLTGGQCDGGLRLAPVFDAGALEHDYPAGR